MRFQPPARSYLPGEEGGWSSGEEGASRIKRTMEEWHKGP